MWYLTSDNDPRVLYVVPQKSEIILGRNTEEHIFTNVEDRSISRQHASLILTEEGLFVKDLGSRYGTYINNAAETLAANQSVKLNNNDIVKFGKLSWEWKVHELNMTTCTSTLKGEKLRNVITILGKIGGIFTNEWDESCLYLTMPVITLTIKVVLALIQGSHIVTAEFWQACLEAVNNYNKLPKPELYMPQIVESAINKEVVSFLPNPERKTLFANKKFVFFTKKYFVMYKQVLIMSGAEPLLLGENQLTKSMLCDKDVIVIQNMSNVSLETQSQREQINDIVSYLKSMGKRVIGDSEIGLAILYCCIDKYCNPDFCFPNEVTKQTVEKNSSNVLAQESQKPTATKNENIVINESLCDESNSNKRKLCEITDGIETNVNKRIALVPSNSEVENINKRKFDEDSDSSDNPSKKIAVNASESEDYFNFINPDETETKQLTEKKLNLSKPIKRKVDAENDDDLFNFIQLNDKSKDVSNNTGTNKHIENKSTSASNIDVSAMRGVKLQELMNNTKFETNHTAIKKEFRELDKHMNELSLGTTVVTVRPDLIIKKEILEINDQIPQCRNFKKFKKVWPLKMQMSKAQS